MKLITSIQVKQADHTQVIDTAAAKVGSAANKAFLFVIDKEIQGWHNFTALCSWGLDRLGQKHGPIYAEVKGSAIAVYHKGCSQETVFVQGLIQAQLTDRLDAHWELHDEAIKWFKAQTNAFLSDQPMKLPSLGKAINGEEAKAEDYLDEGSAEVGSEEQAPDITEEPAPVAEVEEPVSEVEESPVAVLDPFVDPDPLEDEMSIPQDPAPVGATAGGKRPSRTSTRRSALGSMMVNQATTGKPS